MNYPKPEILKAHPGSPNAIRFICVPQYSHSITIGKNTQRSRLDDIGGFADDSLDELPGRERGMLGFRLDADRGELPMSKKVLYFIVIAIVAVFVMPFILDFMRKRTRNR